MHKATAVVCTHLNSHQPYLDLCLRSLELQKRSIDLEIIVVDSRDKPMKTPDFVDKQIVVSHSTIAPIAFNDGFKNAREDSDWYFVVNDDTCIPEGAMYRLIESTKGEKMILNSFCNTDNGWLYRRETWLTNGDSKDMLVPRFMKIGEVKGFEEAMLHFQHEEDFMLRTPFNCFHFTLIPSRLWKLLNGFDENYVSGPDDRDFCLRAAQLGVESWLNAGVTIFHFGGTTVASNPKLEENRKRNAEYFKSKWGYYP